MSKLISNPTECGLRIVDDRPQHVCLNKRIYCPDDKVFPTTCPLQDGIPVPQTIDDIITIIKAEGLIFEATARTKNLQTVTLMEKSYASSVNKPKRRNRKDCIHCFGWLYKSNTYGSCSINNPKYLIDEEHKCSGVNCGHFEPKKE